MTAWVDCPSTHHDTTRDLLRMFAKWMPAAEPFVRPPAER